MAAEHDLTHAIKQALTIEPDTRVLWAEPASREFRQAARDHFRTEQRFQIFSRLIEYGTDELDRMLSADNLGFFGRRGTSFLVRALKSDPSWRVRQHAAVALGRTGDPAAEPALWEALGDPNDKVRLAATESLDVLAILTEVQSPDIITLDPAGPAEEWPPAPE